MSGFLQRLLSRHCGEPAIWPRATSRFELGAAPPGSVEETFVPAVPPLTTEARYAAPAPGPEARAAAVAESPAETPARRPRARVAEHQDPERPPRDTEPARAPLDTPRRRPAVAERADAPLETPAPARVRAIADLADDPEAAPPIETAGSVGSFTIAPRAPLPAASVQRPAPRRGTIAEPAPREPGVVHVHIGRIEVRAVVASPERSRPTAPKAGAPRPLSLDRYLAGKRDR